MSSTMAPVERLIIADAHVGQVAGDAEAMVALLERAAAAGTKEVVYLGDAFQYLVGMEKFWTASVRHVMTAWQELRRAGVRIVLVEGNRDFFLDEPDLAAHIDGSGTRHQFTTGGTTFRLVHGDKVNRRDLQYRFWSMVSKSSVARLWARVLPRAIATAIVRSMESRLAATNVRFRYVKPVDDLRRAARAAWAEGVDVLLWGHFHSFWRLSRDQRTAAVVPAWLETRCAVVVTGEGWWWTDESLTALAGPPTMTHDAHPD